MIVCLYLNQNERHQGVVHISSLRPKMSAALSAVMGAGEEANELCPSLSYTQRLYGFAACLVLGLVFAFMSWMAFVGMNMLLFAMMVTLSNVSSISGSLFLMGPKKQLQKMFEETRLIATIVYLVSIVVTILVAVTIKSTALVIICCIVQYCAMLWYGISYIPFARDAVKGCFKGVVSAV